MIKQILIEEFLVEFENSVLEIEDEFAGRVSIGIRDFFTQRRDGIYLAKTGVVTYETETGNIVFKDSVCARIKRDGN